MLKQFLTLIVLTSLTWGEAWSTPPMKSSAKEVENPSQYYYLVRMSSIPDLFSDCELTESAIPRYRVGMPERVSFKQIYLTPSHFSEFGVQYRLLVQIVLVSDTVFEFGKLHELWAGLREHIFRFESNPVVKEYMRMAKPDTMLFNGELIYPCESQKDGLRYDVKADSIVAFWLSRPEFIEARAMFLAGIDTMSWVDEFETRVGIDYFCMFDGKIVVLQKKKCPSCASNVEFDVEGSHFISMVLSNDHSWLSFPMVEFVREVVRHGLAEDSLCSCVLGSGRPDMSRFGRGHADLKLSRGLRDGIWTVRVAISCSEKPERKAVCFRVLPDSSIEGFQVECYDNKTGVQWYQEP